ncbi:hypothetical protein N2152v2_000724 [Parachlorella kessleri]
MLLHAALHPSRPLFGQGKLHKLAEGLSSSGNRWSRCFSRSPPRPSPRELLRDRFETLVASAKSSRALQELLEEREEDNTPVATKIEWESPLRILQYPDPRLRAVNAKVGVFDDSLRRLTEEMFELMYQDDGVGLAAPQVGVNLRLMVFNETGDPTRKDKELVLANPVVVQMGGGKEVSEEGCLSFPQIYADIVRPVKVKVRAQNVTGKKILMQLMDFPARIFQHEFDHLQGTLFHDRMDPKVLDSVRGELVALEEAYLQQHPGAAIRRL